MGATKVISMKGVAVTMFEVAKLFFNNSQSFRLNAQ
jgi:hypothetical protein